MLLIDAATFPGSGFTDAVASRSFQSLDNTCGLNTAVLQMVMEEELVNLPVQNKSMPPAGGGERTGCAPH